MPLPLIIYNIHNKSHIILHKKKMFNFTYFNVNKVILIIFLIRYHFLKLFQHYTVVENK